jgi:hypothetical protein
MAEKELFHIRYTADFLVSAEDEDEAFDLAEDVLVDMFGDEKTELDEIFMIEIVDEVMHVIGEEEEAEAGAAEKQ